MTADGTSIEPDDSDTVPIAAQKPGIRGFARASMGTAGTLAGMVFGQAANAIALIFIARRTSLSEFGAFIGLYAAAITVGNLIDFGSSAFWSRELARGVPTDGYWRRLTTRTSVACLPVGAFTVVAIATLRDQLPIWCIVGVCLQALTIGIAGATGAAARALSSPARSEWFVAAGNLSLLAAALVSTERTILSLAGVAACVSWLITASLGYATVRARVQPSRSPRQPFENPWRGSRHFGIASLAVTLGGFIVPLVGVVAGSEAAASLGSVSRWSQPVTLIAASYATFMAPRFAAARSDLEAVRLLRLAAPTIGLGLLISLGLTFAAPTLVDSLLGDDYGRSVLLLRLYCLAAIPVLIGQPTVALLQARGQERAVSRAYVIFSSGSVAFSVGLAAAYGAPAVPAVSLAGSALVACWALTRVFRILKPDGDSIPQR